jgi:hypothetical protein
MQWLALALFTLGCVAAMVISGLFQTEAGHEAARWLGF